MSNFRAIATVTATLALQVVQPAAQAAVPGAGLTILRPDAEGEAANMARANVYLYQITPNAAWRNANLATRNSNGQLVQRPQVALDLHYLLTFFGDESRLEPQRMAGSVALAMHATPMLTRKMIHNTIGNSSFPFLADSNLADEVELVKFTPLPLTLEELSKLWSGLFVTKYALSLTYQATVVLIESEQPPQGALPVLEREIFVVPFRHPTIERIRSQAGENAPILVNSTLVIEGRQLCGEVTQLRIGDSDLMTIADATDTQIIFPLAALQPPGSLRAGVRAVQVVHPRMMGKPPVAHVGVESNAFPLVVRPTIVAAQQLPDLFHVTLTVNPEIGKAQRAVLLLNGVNAPRNYSFVAKPRPSFQITAKTLASLQAEGVAAGVLAQLATVDQGYMREEEFWDAVKAAIGDAQLAALRSSIAKYAGPNVTHDSITFALADVQNATNATQNVVTPGEYLVRLQLDGAESMLDLNPASPGYGPKVTIQ